MKKHIYIGFLIILLGAVSCSVKENKILLSNCSIIEYDDTISVIPSPKQDKDLPIGLSYGLYKNRDSKGIKEDNNLVRQFTSYVRGLLNGDKDFCRKFLYRDAIKYHKKKFPLLSEENIWSQYFQKLSSVKQFSDFTFNLNMEASGVVPMFVKKISDDNNVIVVFKTSICLEGRKYYLKLDKLEDCIAFSDTKGKHWEFMTVNDETREILELRFDSNLVNELMNSLLSH